jgi:hypothetical protein
MKFGEAITLLNAGHPITRQGWNGKGMFLVKAGGYSVPAEDARPNGIITKEFLKGRGLTHLEILPHIDMWTAQNTYLAGWLASQSDMLADDWMVYVEMPQANIGGAIPSKPKNPKLHWTQTAKGKKIMAARKTRGGKK